jgi:hypothetical protein
MGKGHNFCAHWVWIVRKCANEDIELPVSVWMSSPEEIKSLKKGVGMCQCRGVVKAIGAGGFVIPSRDWGGQGEGQSSQLHLSLLRAHYVKLSFVVWRSFVRYFVWAIHAVKIKIHRSSWFVLEFYIRKNQRNNSPNFLLTGFSKQWVFIDFSGSPLAATCCAQTNSEWAFCNPAKE